MHSRSRAGVAQSRVEGSGAASAKRPVVALMMELGPYS
jgi:hypothetical protein